MFLLNLNLNRPVVLNLLDNQSVSLDQVLKIPYMIIQLKIDFFKQKFKINILLSGCFYSVFN